MNNISSMQKNNARNRKKTIMVVDNTPLMLSILGSIILGGGYGFTHTRSVKNVMNLIESHKPDLLILRTDRPDMDGYELAEELNEQGNTVPMIFLSDEATKKSVIKAYQMGAKDYITKPFDKNAILNKISRQFV